MFQYSTQGAQQNGHSPRGGAMTAPARVGVRYYDLVGVDAEQGTWEKIKAWGDKETMGVKNKWLVGGAVVVGLAWYGYHARWF